MDNKDDQSQGSLTSCQLAEQHQQDSFLDQIAEQQQEELGYVLPVMGELYNEFNHGDPTDAVLNSEECQRELADNDEDNNAAQKGADA